MDAVIRPKSVIYYERFAWIALAIGLASAAANPAMLAKYFDRSPFVYPLMFAAAIAGQLLWIWLVARKRKNWARWISLVFILIGIPDMIWSFDERFRLNPIATVLFDASFALSAVSVMLLFRGDARAWFSKHHLI